MKSSCIPVLFACCLALGCDTSQPPPTQPWSPDAMIALDSEVPIWDRIKSITRLDQWEKRLVCDTIATRLPGGWDPATFHDINFLSEVGNSEDADKLEKLLDLHENRPGKADRFIESAIHKIRAREPTQ